MVCGWLCVMVVCEWEYVKAMLCGESPWPCEGSFVKGTSTSTFAENYN